MNDENRQTTRVVVRRLDGAPVSDLVATEEPLEIRVEGTPAAVTMRTPGHDLELVTGFLLTEGVIDGADDLHAMAHVDDPGDPRGNTVDVVFASGVPAARRDRANREIFASSSCGVCGKATVDRVVQKVSPLPRQLTPDAALLASLPARLRDEQDVFGQTGGLHAAALFTPQGDLLVVREDIGRHNAVDKVIGWLVRTDQWPMDAILVVSGRAGFEIVQKAVVARLPVLASVGAASSLAVSLAEATGLTLTGFVRHDRMTHYVGLETKRP